MSIGYFIKEEKISMIINMIILLCVNGYFLTLNVLEEKKGDLIYLDLILILIYLLWFGCRYVNWRARYEILFDYVQENKEVDREVIQGKFIAEEIMLHIITKKEEKFRTSQYAYQEQLRDMEEYISKWVHEIKLPISVLSVILEKVEDDEVSYDIKHEMEKINFLVNSVLYGSRTTVSAEDIFILEERLDLIVKQAIKNNAFFLIRKNIEVKIENLNSSIYSDKKWLVYVLDQIINNAIKYSKANGKIEFYGEETDKYITLNIKDNGMGITKEDRERVFNKGFTGQKGRNTTYKSTGMGLYFSKKILDKLGHTIEVESIENEYTLFKIKFSKISDYIKVAKM